jgi:hypothetical protein
MSSSPNKKGAAGAAPLGNPPRVPQGEDRTTREHPVSGTTRCFGPPTISRAPRAMSSGGGADGVHCVREVLEEVRDGVVIDHQRRRDA